MLVTKLRSLGVSSDMLQAAGFASILASIGTWNLAKRSGDAAHAERFGIFIGLWAPTFFALADSVATAEASEDIQLAVDPAI
jgi:hypothetical protein